jgi:hypothetical protein
LKPKESLISAHHNYLVNDMLSPGFLLGDAGSGDGFYFLADVVPPGETVPRISGRLFDRDGGFLVELREGRILQNPGGCTLQNFPGGFRLLLPSGETVLNVSTQTFTNGYMTRVQGRLFDHAGNLRAEPSREGVKVHGEAKMALENPEG